jgi:hypothetical protein
VYVIGVSIKASEHTLTILSCDHDHCYVECASVLL